MAIDADPAGNTISSPVDSDNDGSPDTEQTKLGTIDECVSISSPGTVDVDVVVQGYPSSDPLKAYVVALGYAPDTLEVKSTLTGEAPDSDRTLLSADPQSGPFLSFPIGEIYGGFYISVADRAPLDPDEDIDGTETSDGFLVRFTIDVLAEGLIQLTLGPSSSVGGDEGKIAVSQLQDAQIAVGQPCPGAVTPTPSPTLTPSPTPTPTPTPTPAPTLTVEATPVPTIADLTPSPPAVASPTLAPTERSPTPQEPRSPPSTGAARHGGDRGPLWLAIGLGLGILAVLAGGAVVLARRRVQ
jgi:hypothetical protein